MRVQDCARAAPPHDLQMQASFRGRHRASRADRRAGLIHLQNVRGPHLAFVNRARRDRQTQGFLAHNRAEVAARPLHPAARVEAASDCDEVARDRWKAAWWHVAKLPLGRKAGKGVVYKVPECDRSRSAAVVLAFPETRLNHERSPCGRVWHRLSGCASRFRPQR